MNRPRAVQTPQAIQTTTPRACPEPGHGGHTRPHCSPEQDGLQTLSETHQSAMEGHSGRGAPTRRREEKERPISAPEDSNTHEARSCLATLYTVTSVAVDDNNYTSRHKGQILEAEHVDSTNFISALYGGQTYTQVDPPAEIPCPNAETQVSMLCAAAAREVCGPRLDRIHEGYESCSEREFDYYVDSIMDGLTNESPIMIPSDEPSDVPEVFEDDRNELLRAFMRVRSRTELPQSIILDSTVPELAPHIVISPPTDSPFEVYCPCGGCDRDWPYTPPQSSDCLALPLQQRNHSVNEDLEAFYDQIDVPSVCPPQPDESACDIDFPSRVFSHSWFTQSIEDAEDERLIFYHVVSAIHKRIFKLAVLAASEAAPLFRARWDSDDFRMQVEKPFIWRDPGEPLLLEYAHQPNTIIIDSVDPFIAPHIVISEAPVQNPWELDCIYTPSQNCHYGSYLTHPSYSCHGPCCSSYYSYYSISMPSAQESLPPTAEQQPDEEIVTDDVPCECEDESDDVESDSDSSSSSDTPMTPQDGTFADTHFVLCNEQKVEVGHVQKSFYIDEDDDDLPPFDDWYQSIAQRAA